MIQPTAELLGQFHSVSKNTFKNAKNEEIEYFQLTLLTDSQFYPLMRFSTTKEVFDSIDSKQSSLAGKEITLMGEMSTQSKKIGDERIPVLKFKVTNYEFAK